ncbi:hypothetical protein [Candidatus Nitrosocosmicus franklandus]|nr:hypothetical protein [Candidatus Nitrosocosmicus franklandus]
MALPNLSIEVTENTSSSTFSSLSRDFDQTIENINNDNSNSTETTSDDEESSATETTSDDEESSATETTSDDEEILP